MWTLTLWWAWHKWFVSISVSPSFTLIIYAKFLFSILHNRFLCDVAAFAHGMWIKISALSDIQWTCVCECVCRSRARVIFIHDYWYNLHNGNVISFGFVFRRGVNCKTRHWILSTFSISVFDICERCLKN